MAYLTTAQLVTLKNYINTVPAWSVLPNNSDTAFFIADQLAQTFTPSFTIWKSSVTVAQVGEGMNSNEVGGLTTANSTRLQVMASYSGGAFDPSRADTRAGFDGIFSGAGGTLTRAALLVLYKRLANHLEKLFSTGTGTDASPATMGLGAQGRPIEGSISYVEVQQARNS